MIAGPGPFAVDLGRGRGLDLVFFVVPVVSIGTCIGFSVGFSVGPGVGFSIGDDVAFASAAGREGDREDQDGSKEAECAHRWLRSLRLWGGRPVREVMKARGSAARRRERCP